MLNSWFDDEPLACPKHVKKTKIRCRLGLLGTVSIFRESRKEQLAPEISVHTQINLFCLLLKKPSPLFVVELSERFIVHFLWTMLLNLNPRFPTSPTIPQKQEEN